MKRDKNRAWLLMILVAALCVPFLTGAALATDVDCIFITALYTQTGQYLDSVWIDVPTGDDTPSAADFDNIPVGGYTKTFLRFDRIGCQRL